MLALLIALCQPGTHVPAGPPPKAGSAIDRAVIGDVSKVLRRCFEKHRPAALGAVAVHVYSGRIGFVDLGEPFTPRPTATQWCVQHGVAAWRLLPEAGPGYTRVSWPGLGRPAPVRPWHRLPIARFCPFEGEPAAPCLTHDGRRIRFPRLRWAPDRAILRPRSLRTVDAIAALMIEAGVAHAEVQNHLGRPPVEAYGRRPSQRRAQALVDRLRHAGVTAQLEAKGYGGTRPLVPPTDAANRRINRRSEVHISGWGPAP